MSIRDYIAYFLIRVKHTFLGEHSWVGVVHLGQGPVTYTVECRVCTMDPGPAARAMVMGNLRNDAAVQSAVEAFTKNEN